MPVITPDQINVGDIIKFKTLSPHDNVVWSGEVVSICGYDVARLFGEDIVAYYQDINRNVEGGLKAKEKLTYFVLKTTAADSADGIISERRVFAYEWLDLSTLERIDEQTYVDYRVYDISSDRVLEIKSAINAKGYVVDILNK